MVSPELGPAPPAKSVCVIVEPATQSGSADRRSFGGQQLSHQAARLFTGELYVSHQYADKSGQGEAHKFGCVYEPASDAH